MQSSARRPIAKSAARTVAKTSEAKVRGRIRPRQGELAFRSWGGARRGAGRKPKGERALAPHDTRPVHKASVPLLITTRLRTGLPSLRHSREAERVRAALALVNARFCAEASAPGGPPQDRRGIAPNQVVRPAGDARAFQVVHHSIQSNHLHLIVEASDRAALTSGMRGLLIRVARALNRLWKRRGSVFSDRFHELELRNPRQVRNALVYVLQNLRKHGIALAGPDPFSSGPEFDGWTSSGDRAGDPIDPRGFKSGGGAAHGSAHTPRREERAALPRPRTWLLGFGWQRHGLIDLVEQPKAGRGEGL